MVFKISLGGREGPWIIFGGSFPFFKFQLTPPAGWDDDEEDGESSLSPESPKSNFTTSSIANMAAQPMILLLLIAAAVATAGATPLDDYVWEDDGAYSYTDLQQTISGSSLGTKWTGHLLNMTSQKWLTEEEIGNRHIWTHSMVVIVPDNINDKFLTNSSVYVTGGNNENSNSPTADDEDVRIAAALAVGTGTITTVLFQIPNQHIRFSSDPLNKSRSEDAIIAYTWRHYLDDPSRDAKWLVRLPMVKAVVKAMDTVQNYVSKTKGINIESFTIAGASKRGWTTWLTGAVDPARVVAIVPIVLDALNFVQFSHHQYKSYNGWSFALKDYAEQDIFTSLDGDEMRALQEVEDPYFYLDRLQQPKLVVNAGGDEFQQPDDTSFWWKELTEPKHFLMVKNAEHSLATGILEVVPAISGWMLQLLEKKEDIPRPKWEINNATGDITLSISNSVSEQIVGVRKWFATTCTKNKLRDFRLVNAGFDEDGQCVCGVGNKNIGNCLNEFVLWNYEDVVVNEDGNFVGSVDAIEDGFVAFFLEVTYDAGVRSIFNDKDILDFVPICKPGQTMFTTEVSIVPNVYPFEDCEGDGCKGTLV